LSPVVVDGATAPATDRMMVRGGPEDHRENPPAATRR
jgi:hypothetical protein